MRTARARRFDGVVVVLGSLLAPGCDASPRPSPNLLDAPVSPPLREPDGLLVDSALQRLVDAQAGGTAAELLAGLYNREPSVKARAAFALASMREDFAFQGLVDQISHPDSAVRSNVAFALGQLERPALTRWLSGALDDEAVRAVRAEILRALGKVGSERSVAERLAADPPDVDEPVLVLALARLALRHGPGPSTLERLLAALDARDGESRELAAWYFGRTPSADPWLAHVDVLRDALDGYALDDPAAAGLIRALAGHSDPADLDRILRFGSSPDWRLRVRVMTALEGYIADEAAREAIFAGLDDPSVHVAVAAASTIGGVRRLLEPDMDRTEDWIDTHPDAWRAAGPLLAALAANGRAAFVAGWLEARAAASPRVRAKGIRALARAPDQSVIRPLMAMASSDTVEIAAAALEGLAGRWVTDREVRELHGAYWETFRDALRTADRAAVVTVAPVMPDSVFLRRGSLELLVQVYERLVPVVDLEAQQAVLAALGQIGDPAAAPVVRRATEDPHRTVRLRAGEVLEVLLRERVVPSRAPNAPARLPDWSLLEGLGLHPTLVLETEKGTIRIRMATELAPVTVQTIRELAEAGRYDGVPFHRVVPDFVVQGGDVERGDGYGGPGFALRSEISGIPFLRGVVGLAAAGPDTEGSQFFVTHSRQPHLDDVYVAFGWVADGMDVVDRLYEGDRVVRASVEPDPRGATPEGRAADGRIAG